MKQDKGFCETLLSLFRRQWPSGLLVLSLSVFSFLVFFKLVALDWIVDSQIRKEVRLVRDTPTWNKWVDIPIPIYIKFRFFNVTNPLEVSNGAKPILQEVGPYVYEQKRSKVILSEDKEKDTVTYRQPIHYFYRRDLSSGPESDRIILINVPFVSFAKEARQRTTVNLAHGFIDQTLRRRGERLFMYNSVRNYLFKGVSVEPFVRFLSNPLLRILGRVKIPAAFSGGRFGFYKGKNGSDDGEVVVRTGITNPREFGQIMSWNGKTKLNYWVGNCDMINGTDGSLVSPFLTKTQKLRFFVPDICRSLVMVFKRESEFKGIKAYRFGIPDPKKTIEYERCFCPAQRRYTCFREGVFNMAPCKDGAPITVSGPHFYHAWPPYLKATVGLRPTIEDHDTFLDIEPKTGLILRATKRLQFNIHLERTSHMNTFAKVPDMLFPIMWLEESGELTDELLKEVQTKLFDTVELAQSISIAGLLICSVLILCSVLGCFLVTSSSRSRKGSSESGGLKDLYASGIPPSPSLTKRPLSRSPSTASSRTNSSISRGTMTVDDNTASDTDSKDTVVAVRVGSKCRQKESLVEEYEDKGSTKTMPASTAE